MPDRPSTPKSPDSGEPLPKEGLFTFYPQLLTGFFLGCAITGIGTVIGFKYRTDGGLIVWIGIFAVVWLSFYFIVRRGWNGLVVGLMIGVAIAYYISARVFHTAPFF